MAWPAGMRPMRLLLPLMPLVCPAAAKDDARSPPLVSGIIDSLDAGQTQARIASLRAKSTAAVSRAQAAAAQASISETHVEQLKVQNEMKKPELDRALETATEAATGAVEAAKEAVAALAAVRATAKTAVADAQRLAVEGVKKRMAEKYNQLEEWRTKVLDDPYTRAQAAGKKAAEPYNKMIKAYYKRIGQYRKAAGGLMGKANSLAGGAQGLAGGAQGKLNGGDPVGANQDVMTANAMRSSSASYASAAQALEGEAQNMNHWIADYIAAGHMAAWQAEYEADPDALPPPPVNPNYAFTPPPP